jgi:hypothetical protein
VEEVGGVSEEILQFEVGSRKYNELLGDCLVRRVVLERT